MSQNVQETGSAVRRWGRLLYNGWMSIISWFNWILARVLLTVLFVTIFLLYGIIIRLVEFDPLRRKLDPSDDSYWESNVVTNSALDEFKKLY